MSAPADHANTAISPGFGRGVFGLCVLTLAVLILAMHGRCVVHGLFLDDHAHFPQLRESDWSLRGLTDACRLELVGGYIDMWWLPETTLRFFRPVAFGLMKAVYELSGWRPSALHAASLAWHILNCALLLALLRRLGTGPLVGLGVAAAYSIHPGNVAPVQWIASQTELIVTAFLLGATLCHARWRGWWSGVPGGVGWAVASLALFAAALGCRENAVMFPLVLALGDWATRKRRAPGENAVRAALVYIPHVLLVLGYLALRTYMLGGAALPPKPYVIPPGDPEFVRFVFDKACYYLIGQAFLVPCVPFGGVEYFRQHPLLFYSLSAVAFLLLLGAVILDRGRLAGLLGAAWLVLFTGPVLPSFESPHHLYLPGVGWALLGMLLFRSALGQPPRRDDPPHVRSNRRTRYGLVWFAGLIVGTVFGAVNYFAGLAIHAGQLVEDRVADEVINARHPVRDGDTLYFANLPAISHYVKLTIERRTGLRNLRAVALTWSPRLLGNHTPAEWVAIDDRTLELRIAGDRYFDGPFGKLARQATGREQAVSPGQPVETPDFRVEWLDGDARGISALRFTFRDSLTRPGVHFFWGSRERWAWQTEVAPPATQPARSSE